MGYYDDNDEYYEYEEKEKLVDIISEPFSECEVSEILTQGGLTGTTAPYYSGNMERLVFMYGEDKETYSSSEIAFIKDIDPVFVYESEPKAINKHVVPCRVFSTRIEDAGSQAVTKCVAFEKIINKAFDGFNIFFFVSEDCVFFGCRIFDKGQYDCALSVPISKEQVFEQYLEAFLYTAGYEDFADYYGHITTIITHDQEEYLGYEDSVIGKKGTTSTYFDALDDISQTFGVSVLKEKERYWDEHYGDKEESFISILDDVCNDLDFIKSSRINIYEMLLDAEESARHAEESETINQTNVIDGKEEEEHFIDYEVENVIDNPEEMIKLLKKRRGL